MFYLIYKITNNINGKYYIGAHKTINKNDSYMGSGKLIKQAIEKYGIENFTKEILIECSSIEEMFNVERKLVDLNENSYNLKCGGHGGWDHLIGVKQILTEPRIAGNKKKSDILKDRKPSSNTINAVKQAHKEGKIKYDTFKGKKHTEETKKKVSDKAKERLSNPKNNSQYGTMWITNGVESKKIKKDDIIPQGWNRGRKIK